KRRHHRGLVRLQGVQVEQRRAHIEDARKNDQRDAALDQIFVEMRGDGPEDRTGERKKEPSHESVLPMQDDDRKCRKGASTEGNTSTVTAGGTIAGRGRQGDFWAGWALPFGQSGASGSAPAANGTQFRLSPPYSTPRRPDILPCAQ